MAIPDTTIRTISQFERTGQKAHLVALELRA